MIPHRGRNFIGVAKFVLRDEVIAGTSEDYDLVVSVSGDITESMGGIAMRLEVPDDRTAIGVKREPAGCRRGAPFLRAYICSRIPRLCSLSFSARIGLSLPELAPIE